MNDIHPLDILSGKIVQDKIVTYRFKNSGNNFNGNFPIMQNLHSLEYPAVYFPSIDVAYYFVDGENYSKEDWEKIRLMSVEKDVTPLKGAFSYM